MQNIASLVSKKAHFDVQSRQISPLFSESAKKSKLAKVNNFFLTKKKNHFAYLEFCKLSIFGMEKTYLIVILNDLMLMIQTKICLWTLDLQINQSK